MYYSVNKELVYYMSGLQMYIPDNCQFTGFLIFVFRTNRGIRYVADYAHILMPNLFLRGRELRRHTIREKPLTFKTRPASRRVSSLSYRIRLIQYRVLLHISVLQRATMSHAELKNISN
jgi:hypothetical protein